MYGAKRLEHHIRSFTHNWVEQKYYLKCDLANFFVSIDKNILWELMDTKLVEGPHQEVGIPNTFQQSC